MTYGKIGVSPYALGTDFEVPQMRVKKQSAAGANFAVYDLNIGAAKVRNAANCFGIPPGNNDSFLPDGERYYDHGVLPEHAAYFRSVRFA